MLHAVHTLVPVCRGDTRQDPEEHGQSDQKTDSRWKESFLATFAVNGRSRGTFGAEVGHPPNTLVTAYDLPVPTFTLVG